MTTDNNKPAQGLAAGLVEAQRCARAVAKDATNPHHRYRYASSEDVIEEARGALGAGGLALFAQSAIMREIVPGYTYRDEKGAEQYEPPSFVVAVSYSLVHTSGEQRQIESHTPVIPEKGRPMDKALAAAKTYDLAYTLRSLLLLPRGTDGDDVESRDDRSRGGYDRERAVQREAPPMPRPQAPAPKPAPAPDPVAPQAPAKPTTKPTTDPDLRAWWRDMQGLGWDADSIRDLVAEMLGEVAVRDLTASQRVMVLGEAQRRGPPKREADSAREMVREARGGR